MIGMYGDETGPFVIHEGAMLTTLTEVFPQQRWRRPGTGEDDGLQILINLRLCVGGQNVVDIRFHSLDAALTVADALQAMAQDARAILSGETQDIRNPVVRVSTVGHRG